ncbi:MAG: apolipoprotein N-acyltransferase [Gammaproteobacteria bacterium]
MRLTERGRDAAALVAGAAWPLAFAPLNWWPVAPASLVALFLLLDGSAPRRAAMRGFAFGAGLFGAGVWWVFISMNHFGGLHWSLSAVITVVLIATLALFPAGFGWLAARWQPIAGGWRWLVGLPALWVAVEWLRSWLLSGFPWLLAGYAVDDTPLGAWAPVSGVLALSAGIAVTAGAFAWLLRTPRPRTAVIGAIVCGVVWGSGAVLSRVEWTSRGGAPLDVALLQGNIGQDIKWASSSLVPTIDLYQGLTEQHWDADLIVWPEAALPALKHQLDPYLDELAARAARNEASIVMGILVREGTAAPFDYFNAVLSLDDGGLYYKRHLVPFGEFFPIPGFMREWLRMLSLPYSDFTRGPRDQPPLRAAGQALAASICYEAAYGAEMIRALPEATLLVNVSNDAWFGDSIAPHQHLQIVRMRAREASRWLVRATNSGITAVVAPDGRLAATIPQFEVGVLRASVQPLAGATPYSRTGNWPLLILIGVLLGVSARLRYA